MNIFKKAIGKIAHTFNDLDRRAAEFIEEKRIRDRAEDDIKTGDFSSDMERSIMEEAWRLECQRKNEIAEALVNDKELAEFYKEAWVRVSAWAPIGTVRALRRAEGCAMGLAVHRREMDGILARKPSNPRKREALMEQAYDIFHQALRPHAGKYSKGRESPDSANLSWLPVETALDVYTRLTSVAAGENEVIKSAVSKSPVLPVAYAAPDVVDDFFARVHTEGLEAKERARVESLMALSYLNVVRPATQSAAKLFEGGQDKPRVDDKSELERMFEGIRKSHVSRNVVSTSRSRKEGDLFSARAKDLSSDQGRKSEPKLVIKRGCLGIDMTPLPAGFRPTKVTISGPGFPARTIDLDLGGESD